MLTLADRISSAPLGLPLSAACLLVPTLLMPKAIRILCRSSSLLIPASSNKIELSNANRSGVFSFARDSLPAMGIASLIVIESLPSCGLINDLISPGSGTASPVAVLEGAGRVDSAAGGGVAD